MDDMISQIKIGLLAIFNGGVILRAIILFVKGMSEDDVNVTKILKKYIAILAIANSCFALIDVIKSYF